MTLSRQAAGSLAKTRSLLHSLIEVPDLAGTIRVLPAPIFATLIKSVGVEDAGELLAVATTEQLVAAFDEDLFVSDRAGGRERLDVDRFAVWLEVLLEAGDDVAAERVSELDEDFVAHALSGIVLVLDEEALRQRLDDGDEDEARQVDKALESALAEDIDGYLLVAKRHGGWDAALSLLLALDRSHRPQLVRLLDRLAAVAHGYLDDLSELQSVLTEGESLAEDAEAAREARRSKQGYVEARAARAFLSLARRPLPDGAHTTAVRDPLTRAYFRELDRDPEPRAGASSLGTLTRIRALPPARDLASSATDAVRLFSDALRELREVEPELFAQRMEELAYLANVLVAGHERDRQRLTPKAAADAVLATVCFGAILEFRAGRTPAKGDRQPLPTRAELTEVLRQHPADLLFRVASSALLAGDGVLYSPEELESAILGHGSNAAGLFTSYGCSR